MKKLNKLFVKIFSVMLSVMLLNVSAFASRYAIINSNYSGPGVSGLQVHLWGTKTNPLLYYDYSANSGDGGAFLIEQDSYLGLDMYYGRFNGNTAANGGAVAQMSSDSGCTVFQNTGFDYNTATNGSGGAVYIADGAVEIIAESGEKSWLYSNKSTEKGGAIYNDGELQVGIKDYYGYDIEFCFNEAGTSGGAIYNGKDAEAKIYDYIEFSTNTAASRGGAIHNEGKMSIGAYTTFQGNQTRYYGGAVYNTGKLTISSYTIFSLNKSTDTSNGKGGAIYNYNGSVTLDSSIKFNENTAREGGAIYNTNGGNFNIGSSVNFSSNTSGTAGGAIYNHASSTSTFTIGNYASFYNNKASVNNSGGAIYNYDSKMEIGNRAIFEDNSAGYGGAIAHGDRDNVSTIKVGDSSRFINNTAASRGGAIHSDTDDMFTVGEYVSFMKNSAGDAGGAISITNGGFAIGRDVNFSSNVVSNGSGGAIANFAGNLEIGVFTKFYGNSAKEKGGAIYNDRFSNTYGTVIVSSDTTFTKNTAQQGGAIYNTGIVNLYRNVNFSTNTANGSGGAIYNEQTGNVNIADYLKFFGNSSGSMGGAIYNQGKTSIGAFTTFRGNQTKYYGGAICNTGELTVNRNVIFSLNKSTDTTNGKGGAIYNYNGSVTLDSSIKFNENTAREGGAIYNTNGGNFNIGSSVEFSSNTAGTAGGAIYNHASSTSTFKIGKNASFYNNKASVTNSGGAIYNYDSKMEIGNRAVFEDNSAGYGGAIYNTGTSTIEQDSTFRNNLSNVNGGAIYNMGSFYVGGFSQFDQNYACGDGGAIYNEEGTVTIAAGAGGNPKFTYNESESNGGAVYNLDSIELYGVIFDGNKARKDGGAIYNVDSLTLSYESKFNNNSAGEYGGAIYNVGYITSTYYAEFTNNSSNGDGGAIYNDEGHIQIGPYSTFSSNRAVNGVGGAINNNKGEVIIGYDTEFTNNSAKDGSGAIRNSALGTVKIVGKANFTGNTSDYGGAIENYGTMTFGDGAIFIDNTANVAGGGAILNSGTLNLTANYYPVEFTGNTSGGEQIAIYNQQNSTLNLWANKNVRFVFNDKITSNNSSGNTLNINQSSGTAPTNGTIELNADMSGYKGTVNLYNGTIELCENGTWFGGNLTVSNSPTIDMVNNFISEHNFNNLTINNVLNLNVEADLANAEMDTISATSFGNGTGKINVKAITILSDIDEHEMIEIAFADDILKDKVESVDKASSRLYNYKVKYDQNTGHFRFINGVLTKNMGTAASAVSASAGGAATQSLVANQVFASMDGKVSNSKKASMDPSNLYVSAGDQVFDNSGKIERGLWLKPFMSQETVKIGDADVDNNLYGTLAGIDFPLGQDKQVSFYLGYAGSKQEVEDVKSNQTGYVLGATGMMIKDNWYAGLTANVMFNKASIDTDFGTDDVDMNMFSIGAKAGYNFNISDSFVLEPNLTLVYGVVNSQEYETSQGAQIDSQSVNNISVEPQVKAKFEIGNGWQPYGLLGYSANLGSKPTVKTEGVELELDSIDGYVEYGAGVNKDFIGTVWSCYAQVTGRSGGRNGFAGNLGVKYKF